MRQQVKDSVSPRLSTCSAQSIGMGHCTMGSNPDGGENISVSPLEYGIKCFLGGKRLAGNCFSCINWTWKEMRRAGYIASAGNQNGPAASQLQPCGSTRFIFLIIGEQKGRTRFSTCDSRWHQFQNAPHSSASKWEDPPPIFWLGNCKKNIFSLLLFWVIFSLLHPAPIWQWACISTSFLKRRLVLSTFSWHLHSNENLAAIPGKSKKGPHREKSKIAPKNLSGLQRLKLVKLHLGGL